jgi:hypothetical protein
MGRSGSSSRIDHVARDHDQVVHAGIAGGLHDVARQSHVLLEEALAAPARDGIVVLDGRRVDHDVDSIAGPATGFGVEQVAGRKVGTWERGKDGRRSPETMSGIGES